MSMSIPRQIVAIAAAAMATLLPAPAYGDVITGTFHDVQSTVDTGVLDYPCFEGVEGNGTTTDVIDGRFIDTANGFHVHGVIQRDYTLAFDDGRHVLGHVTEHFDFNTGSHSTTDTGASQETATVHAAGGSILGTIRLQDNFHVRYDDTNRNGTPDPGEISAWVERSHLSCPLPRRRSAPLAEATPDIGQERFWARYPSRGSYLGHAALVALIYEVINVLTTWRQDVIVSLAAGQVIALAILGTMVYLDAAGGDRTSEIGGLFALGVAVALPHIAFGGVFYASVSIVELFRDIPGGQLRLAVLRPVPYWQFLPTFFTLAGLLWALLLYRRVTDPGPGQSQRESEVRDDYGASLPEDWVRKVAFKRLQPLIARMPGSLLAQPGKLLAVWLFLGIVGWLGVFTPDTNVATAFSRAFASELWGYVTLVVSGLAVFAVIGTRPRCSTSWKSTTG